MKHKGCGGEITERPDEPGYRYCSNHDDAECECATVYPVIRCTKCHKEIYGDAQIEIEEP